MILKPTLPLKQRQKLIATGESLIFFQRFEFRSKGPVFVKVRPAGKPGIKIATIVIKITFKKKGE
jgi:hypothetical protein